MAQLLALLSHNAGSLPSSAFVTRVPCCQSLRSSLVSNTSGFETLALVACYLPSGCLVAAFFLPAYCLLVASFCLLPFCCFPIEFPLMAWWFLASCLLAARYFLTGRVVVPCVLDVHERLVGCLRCALDAWLLATWLLSVRWVQAV